MHLYTFWRKVSLQFSTTVKVIFSINIFAGVNEIQLEDGGTLTCGKMLPLVILNHSDGEVTCCPMNDPLFNCTLRFFPELAEEFVESCFWKKNIPTLNELVLVQRREGILYSQ
jgi:hypothetical protein